MLPNNEATGGVLSPTQKESSVVNPYTHGKEIVPVQAFDPLPKQKLFQYLVFCSHIKFLWYCGGFGSGKTLIGAETAIRLAMMASNGRGLIARQTAVDLKATTMKTFWEVVDQRLIAKHNKSEQLITFVNGHEIYYWGLDDIERLKSLELGWFWLDEVNEIEENSFNVLKGRLRHKAQPKRLGIITSNSEGKNWTYKQFVKGKGVKSQYRHLYHTIKAPSDENKFLPEDYLDVLESYTGDLYDRYVKASFNVFEGQIFPDFNPAIHVIAPFTIPAHWDIVRAIDHGERNPTAVIWCAVAPSGNVYAFREYSKSEKSVHYHARQVKKFEPNSRVLYTVIDPSVKSVRGQTGRKIDTEWKEEMGDDFNLVYGNNDVSTGIARIHKYLAIDKNALNPITKKHGSPKFFIFNTCPILIEEMENYKWKKIMPTSEDDPIEKPRKKDDHLLDDVRYLLMSRPDISLLTVKSNVVPIKSTIPNISWQQLKKDPEAVRKLHIENPDQLYYKIHEDGRDT